MYGDDDFEYYEKTPDYEVVNMSDLKKYDVFIKDDIKEPKLPDFKIFVGKDSESDFIFQYIDSDCGLEYVSSSFYVGKGLRNYKVKRFLR